MNFNPRSYKRSDSIGFFFVANDLIFQSTLLQEERQDLIFRSAVEFLFQSTLLQEERRGIFTQKTDRNLISIHAPTRGATLMNFLTDVLYEFQSTLLQEERHVGNGYMYWISKISIHAPTRGATHGPCECLQLYPYFNPRSYKRSDYYDVVVDRDVDLFQSTLLQEERPFLGIFAPDCCQFQSTLLQEERQGAIFLSSNSPRFQSTLLQEERRFQ